ncbi:MAG: FMN-binding protein [Draconibacterium sp.]|nr:FMN-binding protein [Draconibacterium sp.]
MKTKSNFFLIIILFGMLISSTSMAQDCKEDGSLDEIKAYMPDNKYFKTGFKGLHFVLETHPISKTDTLFWRLINAYNLPTTCDSVVDGTFTGESPYDQFDYKHVVELTIEDGKITKVDYNKVHKDGSDKKSDKKYNEEMSVSGTTPAIAYPEMEKQLLEKQKMWEVDATSGATYSLYRFRYAVTLALIKAEMASKL